jgi:hypothetical protein
MSGASGAPPGAPEERETQREGLEETRRWPAAPSAGSRREKQAEIDHLHDSLTGVLGQLANFEGVAEIIRDYQKCMQPWNDNEPVDLEYCRGCGGRGIRDGMEIVRLTAICRKTKCGPLENVLVRLRSTAGYSN